MIRETEVRADCAVRGTDITLVFMLNTTNNLRIIHRSAFIPPNRASEDRPNFNNGNKPKTKFQGNKDEALKCYTLFSFWFSGILTIDRCHTPENQSQVSRAHLGSEDWIQATCPCANSARTSFVLGGRVLLAKDFPSGSFLSAQINKLKYFFDRRVKWPVAWSVHSLWHVSQNSFHRLRPGQRISCWDGNCDDRKEITFVL